MVSNSEEIWVRREGREVAVGGRGGAAAAAADDELLLDDEFKSTRELSSRVREVSKGSRPPFSASLVKRSLRLQM